MSTAQESKSTTPSRFVKVRKCLERNKIFFETIAALLLSGMAVILSYVQYTDANRERTVHETAQWGELRNAMWDIIDLSDPFEHGLPGSGYDALSSLPKREMVSWLNSVLRILDSQISNPVLIQSKTCLGYWRNAISTARIHGKLLRSVDAGPEKVAAKKQRSDQFVMAVSSISRDVGFVWKKLVLDSDEVSATGGRPKENGSP